MLQLRLNKVSELIHNSSKHRNLEMAKVSVHFQEIIDTVSYLFPSPTKADTADYSTQRWRAV